MIEVQHLTKTYGHTAAVDDVSFTVRPGLVTGLLGPNGAGKSTMMRAILGRDLPFSGRVLINARPLHELVEPAATIGASLDPWVGSKRRTARNHLRSLGAKVGVGSRRVEEVLELVELNAIADRPITVRSLGTAQRLGIAAALLADPQILLLDEPMNGLDPDGMLWLRTLLRGLAAEGRTVLVSSSVMSDLELIADHLVIVGKGHVLADVSMAELLTEVGDGRVCVTTPHADRLVGLLTGPTVRVVQKAPHVLEVSGVPAVTIGEIVACHGLAVHDLHPATASLEEAYMNLTHASVTHRSTPALAGSLHRLLRHSRTRPHPQ